ncbi:hypothetical protein CEJ45_19390 [Herbaspirillum aquaticum]|uniref:Uncharacterized protein n=1 Tax=Herbaspirillum aquaticum TaxID=568783 RepID=A0A225SPC3_9BURK|nr:hypothetical protein CEJ45_19390 [Herbaspirillum aquaticum]
MSAQRRINVLSEVSATPDKGALSLYSMPGLTLFSDLGDTPVRGMIEYQDFMYVVHRGTFYEINNAGVATPRGSIGTTTGRVQLSQNGLQIGLADGAAGYMYTLDRRARTIQTLTSVGALATMVTNEAHGRKTGETIIIAGATPAAYNGTFTVTVVDDVTMTFTLLSSPGTPASPAGAYTVDSSFTRVTSELFVNPFDITWGRHYFIWGFNDSGQFQLSAIDDGTQADGLDFGEAESEPDRLVRVMFDHGELVLPGTNTTEYWGSSTGDLAFSPQPGSTAQFGVAAPWSMVKFNDSIAALMRNELGQVQVMFLQNHVWAPLNGTDMNFTNEINTYANVDDATGLAYNLGGHPIYQINFPTAGKSWRYDAATGDWSELQSGLKGGRHRGEIAVNYLNKIRISDFENGKIYTLDPEAVTDNGMQRPWEITSRHLFQNLNDFRTGAIFLDFEVGVGLVSGQGQDPQVMLQVSRDNGKTWGNELWRSLGKVGEYRRRIVFRRLGHGRDFVFRLRVTDPVNVTLAAAGVLADA